jgi:hypothetical protein
MLAHRFRLMFSKVFRRHVRQACQPVELEHTLVLAEALCCRKPQ